LNSLGAPGKFVCPMTNSISHDQWHASSDDSDYDDSDYDDSDYDDSDYDGSEDMSYIGSAGSEYSSPLRSWSPHSRRRAKQRRFAHFSSLESAILHAHNFVLSIFYNISSPSLPVRPIHECPYVGSISKDGKRDGLGTFYFDNGTVFQGTWRDDFVCDGPGQAWYADGSYYCGEFQSKLRHGSGTMLYKDSNKYEGTWHSGSRCCGKIVYKDGSSYTGEFRGGKGVCVEAFQLFHD
jgi:hypothetical protein